MNRIAATAPETSPAARYRSIRRATLLLAAGLSAEDCALQSMPDASPVKWHLAHTTWFFETFLLEQRPRYRRFDAAYRVLFNSYYNGVGDKHPRAEAPGTLSQAINTCRTAGPAPRPPAISARPTAISFRRRPAGNFRGCGSRAIRERD